MDGSASLRIDRGKIRSAHEARRAAFAAEGAALVGSTPSLERRLRPADIFGAVVFLASTDRDLMAGQLIVVYRSANFV